MNIVSPSQKVHWIEPVTGSFLQSWDWGEFQTLAGHKSLRLQAKEGHTIVGQLQGFEYRPMPGVRYLYVPKYGPSAQTALPELCKELKKQRFSFIIIEPTHEIDTSYLSYITRGSSNRQPKSTLILSLGKSEKDLLESFHQKTRYNIRLAEKKGVEIRAEKNAELFWSLNTETTARDTFVSHSKKYYEHFIAQKNVTQFTAYYNESAVASILCIGYGNTYTYVHGASGDEHRNVMAPYLLQWHAIRFAKAHGFAEYDFWGVAQIHESGSECFNNMCWNKKYKLSGVTRFKVGFGGRHEVYPQAFDIVLSRWSYIFYKLASRAVRAVRG